jgi:signal transduction histidine kinase
MFNLVAKGMILLLFLLAGPFLFNHFAIKNTDLKLTGKRDQVLGIIEREGIGSFFQEEDLTDAFGSYNILKEEYILLEKLIQPYPLKDTIYNEERILEDVSVQYRVSSLIFPINEEYFLLEIGRSLETIQETKILLYKITSVSFLIFLILSLTLDVAFNKRLIRPLRMIIKRKLTHINEPQQFPYEPITTTTIDFQILDDSISKMMRRIQKSFNDERIFISHASHELKTPIAILQSKIEAFFADENLTEKEMDRLMDMQSTIQKFKKTVHSLLLLSKVNNAQFLKIETVAMEELLDEFYEEWQSAAEDKDITLSLAQNEPFELHGTNASLVQIMIQNALLNAIKYTPAGGTIEICGINKKSKYHVVIRDSGKGISEDLMNQVKDGIVFLKDAKVDKSGFGLQIIHKIAGYLGVKIQLKSGPEGTEFTFKFKYQPSPLLSKTDQENEMTPAPVLLQK